MERSVGDALQAARAAQAVWDGAPIRRRLEVIRRVPAT